MYKILVENLKKVKSLGKPSCRQKQNVKKDIKQIGCEGVYRLQMDECKMQWHALVNTVIKFQLSRPYVN